MNIDHHLQQSILGRLAASDVMVRYSDLKEGDIENSLFSYHLNKLIDRGMVEKKDDGYVLSVDGARWLNDNGFTLQSKESPRVTIALLVQNENQEYLVGQRSGQLQAINDYMLLTRPYTNDTDLDTQIQQAIAACIPPSNLVETAEFGFVQIKATYTDDRVMRNLFCVMRCKVRGYEPSAGQSWMSWDEIVQLDHPSATILRGIIEYTGDDSHRRSTPLFAG